MAIVNIEPFAPHFHCYLPASPVDEDRAHVTVWGDTWVKKDLSPAVVGALGNMPLLAKVLGAVRIERVTRISFGGMRASAAL